MRTQTVALLAACGLALAGCSAGGDKPATSQSAQQHTVTTATELATKAGLNARSEVTDTELYTQTTALIGDGSTRVYTFANEQARTQYLAAAQSFGGVYEQGQTGSTLWVVGGDNPDLVHSIAAKLADL